MGAGRGSTCSNENCCRVELELDALGLVMVGVEPCAVQRVRGLTLTDMVEVRAVVYWHVQ